MSKLTAGQLGLAEPGQNAGFEGMPQLTHSQRNRHIHRHAITAEVVTPSDF